MSINKKRRVQTNTSFISFNIFAQFNELWTANLKHRELVPQIYKVF